MKRMRWLIKFACIGMACLALNACNAEEESYFTKFQTAITNKNYVLADDLYALAANESAFDPQEYQNIIIAEINTVVEEYEKGTKQYDEAYLNIDSYKFALDWSEAISDKIAEAKASIKPDDAISHHIEQATLLAKSGAYREALAIMDGILQENPSLEEARAAKRSIVSVYVADVVKKAENLLEAKQARAALKVLDIAIDVLGEDETLQKTKLTAEAQIKEQDQLIKNKIPEFELQDLFEKNDLKGASEYVDKLEEGGYDVTEFRSLIESKIDAEIEKYMVDAEALAEKGGGSASALRDAVLKINEGIAKYPEDERLIQKKSELEKRLPKLVSPSIDSTSGYVRKDVSGEDANGGVYTAGHEFPVHAMKPDSSLEYNVGRYQKSRVVINPKTADASTYENFVVDILINGQEVYSDIPFSIETGTVDLTFDVASDSVITIRVKQSGFASFFEGILDRNMVYVRLYLIA